MNELGQPTPPSAADVERVISALEPRLGEYYPEVRDANARLTLRRQRPRRWSYHLLFEICSGRRPTGRFIMAKLPFERNPERPSTGEVRPPSDAESFELEYQALQAIWETVHRRRPAAEITAIRPLGFLADLNAVVMEFLPGSKSLLELTRRAARPLAGRRRLVRARDAAVSGGRLLRFIHDEVPADPPRACPFDLDVHRSQWSRCVDLVVDTGVDRGVLEDRAKRLFSRMRNVREEVWITAVHGDLYPGNILRTAGGAVCAVDATFHRQGPALEDVAKLCVGLETFKRAFLFTGSGRRTVHAVRDGFITGYFGSENLPALLPFFQILALMRRWYEVRDVIRKKRIGRTLGADPILRRVDNFVLERVDRLASALGAAPG